MFIDWLMSQNSPPHNVFKTLEYIMLKSGNLNKRHDSNLQKDKDYLNNILGLCKDEEKYQMFSS